MRALGLQQHQRELSPRLRVDLAVANRLRDNKGLPTNLRRSRFFERRHGFVWHGPKTFDTHFKSMASSRSRSVHVGVSKQRLAAYRVTPALQNLITGWTPTRHGGCSDRAPSFYPRDAEI